MAEILVGRTAELENGDRRIVSHDGVEIGVFRWNDEFFAYRNHCLHQGGPACEGLLMHRVVEVLGEDKTYQRMAWDKNEMHFVCPWHGWEFDIRTGENAADRRLRIRSYRTEVRGEELYVHA
jgi:nitrite reductase/ring-hydroxylating ferredoxin subunit